jgi:SET domain-containing protein
MCYSPARNAYLRTNIDATYVGSIARFLNHSCNPNLVSYPVRVDNIVPRVGFFARKDISANTEITVDYGSRSSVHSTSGKAYPCHCGSVNCKRFLPFNPYV